MRILSDERSNAKLSKNAAHNTGYRTSILYLAPADMAIKGVSVCPASTAGCRKVCLFSSGMGAIPSVAKARIRKTLMFLQDRQRFLDALTADLEALVKRQQRTGVKQAVRLNGTSDIYWENYIVMRDGVGILGLPQAFPELQFYDYTKIPTRAMQALTREDWPKNYALTFSRSEHNSAVASKVAAAGGNVAVVFSDTLPSEYFGRPVIDGTTHDMRFIDPKGVVVGLLPKGKAKKDTSGFVVQH